MKQIVTVFLFLVMVNPVLAEFKCAPDDVLPENSFPTILFETTMGNVEVELNRMRAPANVNNFLQYVIDGHYDGTIFHRVIKEFVVQGGGYDESWEERPLREPVMNESGNGLKNNAWTIAMARFSDPHSATSQFFFNVNNNNSALDPGSRNWGYTVFGDVISGQDVLQAISEVDTGYNAEVDFQDVPLVTVKLIKVSIQ